MYDKVLVNVKKKNLKKIERQKAIKRKVGGEGENLHFEGAMTEKLHRSIKSTGNFTVRRLDIACDFVHSSTYWTELFC